MARFYKRDAKGRFAPTGSAGRAKTAQSRIQARVGGMQSRATRRTAAVGRRPARMLGMPPRRLPRSQRSRKKR
jgi:hypothetical protein